MLAAANVLLLGSVEALFRQKAIGDTKGPVIGCKVRPGSTTKLCQEDHEQKDPTNTVSQCGKVRRDSPLSSDAASSAVAPLELHQAPPQSRIQSSISFGLYLGQVNFEISRRRSIMAGREPPMMPGRPLPSSFDGNEYVPRTNAPNP